MRSGAVAYLARRLAVSAFLVWAMTVVVFVLFFLIPAEPTNFIVRGATASQFQRQLAREQLGLDAPSYVVYGRWVWRLAPSQTQVLLMLWPSIAIFVTVLSLHLLGEGLRDALDPRGTRR